MVDLSGNDYDFTVSGNPPFDSSIKGGVINFQAGGDYATNNSDPILNVNSYTKFAVFNPLQLLQTILFQEVTIQNMLFLWPVQQINFELVTIVIGTK
jgi:hypothetical protein